jgi:hypothetical protein
MAVDSGKIATIIWCCVLVQLCCTIEQSTGARICLLCQPIHCGACIVVVMYCSTLLAIRSMCYYYALHCSTLLAIRSMCYYYALLICIHCYASLTYYNVCTQFICYNARTMCIGMVRIYLYVLSSYVSLCRDSWHARSRA